MWMVRILKGPNQGLIFPLSSGVNTIGRASSCSIQIDASGISRNHVELHVKNAEILLVDKDSSNGTYINGVRVHNQVLETGDQVSIHKVVFDIIRNPFAQGFPQKHASAPISVQGSAAPQMPPAENLEPGIAPQMENMNMAAAPAEPKKWWEHIAAYVEKAVLPGVYKLPEWMEFKWVIGLFALGFIFLVSAFSSIPMTRILKSSVKQESMNHAESIAESLALENRSALQEGVHTSVSVDYALRRPGVKKAFIIKAGDGRIIAPVEHMHDYPKDSFIHKVRKTGQRVTEKINSSTIGAMIPIKFFNPETNSQSVMAYSVVFYDIQALSINNSQTLSLIVQSLFISILLGSLLFFFMYKIITFPIESINEKLSQALKDSSQDVSTKYQFPALSDLCANINSTLERMNSFQDQQEQAQAPIDRTQEMSNLVELVGFPCICIQIDSSTIIAVNAQFEPQTGLPNEKLLYQPIDSIEDVPLQLNLKEAIEKVSSNPSETHVDQIEFNSNSFQVTAQGIYGNKELAYILAAFIPEESS